MNHGVFVTAVNCMDGRTQLPVIEWLKHQGADYVDMITEPGPVRILAESRDEAAIESIRRRVAISVEKHGSTRLAIVAHHDCAGNPVDMETQLHQLRLAAATVLTWGFGVHVDLLWVGDDWQVGPAGQTRSSHV